MYYTENRPGRGIVDTYTVTYITVNLRGTAGSQDKNMSRKLLILARAWVHL